MVRYVTWFTVCCRSAFRLGRRLADGGALEHPKATRCVKTPRPSTHPVDYGVPCQSRRGVTRYSKV